MDFPARLCCAPSRQTPGREEPLSFLAGQSKEARTAPVQCGAVCDPSGGLTLYLIFHILLMRASRTGPYCCLVSHARCLPVALFQAFPLCLSFRSFPPPSPPFPLPSALKERTIEAVHALLRFLYIDKFEIPFAAFFRPDEFGPFGRACRRGVTMHGGAHLLSLPRALTLRAHVVNPMVSLRPLFRSSLPSGCAEHTNRPVARVLGRQAVAPIQAESRCPAAAMDALPGVSPRRPCIG